MSTWKKKIDQSKPKQKKNNAIKEAFQDPILTAFELSWELRQLAFAEYEFKSEYLVRS